MYLTLVNVELLSSDQSTPHRNKTIGRSGRMLPMHIVESESRRFKKNAARHPTTMCSIHSILFLTHYALKINSSDEKKGNCFLFYCHRSRKR